jgi:hypothetical protein
MTWNERVDRAFARRREELLEELVADSRRASDELSAVVDSVATNHPLAYVGTGVVAGIGVAMMRGSPRDERPARPRWWSAHSALRFIRFGARLLG